MSWQRLGETETYYHTVVDSSLYLVLQPGQRGRWLGGFMWPAEMLGGEQIDPSLETTGQTLEEAKAWAEDGGWLDHRKTDRKDSRVFRTIRR